MKRILLQVMFLTLFFYLFNFFTFPVPLWAKGGGVEIGVIREHFNWKEFSPDGTLVLEESGLRKGINIAWKKNYIFGNFNIYRGTVRTDDPILLLNLSEGAQHLPKGAQLYSGDVSYFDMKGISGIGFPQEVSIGYIPVNTTPYLCLVFDYRLKSVILSTDSGDKNIGDYEETWTILFWKIGVKNEIKLFFVQFALNLWLGSDLLSRNLVNISGIDFLNLLDKADEVTEITPKTVELKPDGSFFYGIGLSLKYYKFFIKGYYKHFKWKKSPEEKIYVEYEYEVSPSQVNKESFYISVSQPESEENDFGIVIGIFF